MILVNQKKLASIHSNLRRMISIYGYWLF